MTTPKNYPKTLYTSFKIYFSLLLLIITQTHLQAQIRDVNAPARKNSTLIQNSKPAIDKPANLTKQQEAISTGMIKRLNTTSVTALKNDFTTLVEGAYTIVPLQLPGNRDVKDYYVKKLGSRLILDGDIIVGDVNLPSVMSYTINDNKPFLSPKNLYRWPGGDVPVTLDNSVFETNSYETIKSALDFFNFNTGIVFKERTNEEDYVYITVEKGVPGKGGSSPVGRQKGGSNILRLVTGQFDQGTVLHELMHALGVYHEQGRSDRDNFITIHLDKIEEYAKHDFQIESDGTARSSYDYCSIMHYPEAAFSTDGNLTITCKTDGKTTGCPSCMGTQSTLSKWDLKGLEKLYGEIGVSRFPSKMPFSYSKIPIAGCLGLDDYLIKSKWENYKEALGDCKTGVIEMGVFASKYVQFERGMIYHTPRGVFVIYGNIYQLFKANNAVNLGLPTSDEEDINDSEKGLLSSWKLNGYTRINRFENGVIIWGAKRNAVALTNEKFAAGPVKASPLSEKASPTPLIQQKNNKITKAKS